MEKKHLFRWQPWMAAILFFVNLILLFAGDCLIHFPVRGSLYTSPAEVFVPDLESSTVLHDEVVVNIRLFTIRGESGETRLLALEQCGPIARCRIVENDAPPSLPWAYFIQGKAVSLSLNVTEDGGVEVWDMLDHYRPLAGQAFLCAFFMGGAEILIYRLIKKASKSKKILHFSENNP